MKSIASAPGKVILFGEHFVVFGVKAILASINKRVTVTSNLLDQKKIIIKSDLENSEIASSELLPLNSTLKPFEFITKKMIKEFKSNNGVEISIKSEIPPGVGLGSSSACCVAAAASISKLFTNYSKEEILKLAIDAERTIFKDTSGADCTVSTYGGIIEYEKASGFQKINSQPIFNLIIANSKQTHSTFEVVEKVKSFKNQNSLEFENICNEESQLIEDVLIALKKSNLKKIGSYMTKNQSLLQRIGVSNEKLTNMINLAEKSAVGAKITGAGGGGCIIVMVENVNLDKTIESLKSFDPDCFSAKIDYQGLDTF